MARVTVAHGTPRTDSFRAAGVVDEADQVKLPDVFLGTVAALLRTPPPPKAKKAVKRKTEKRGAKKR